MVIIPAKKPINNAQRVGVFVDVQNLYYSAKQMFNSKINYKALLEDSVSGRQLVRAIAYVIKADVKDEKNFFDALESIGYDVKAKDLQIFYGGAKKGDWDVGIAMDTIELAPKLDVVVLVSGDGDYVPLVHHLRSVGCRIEVIALKGSTSAKLIEVADSFLDLESNKRRYMFK